MRLKGNIVYSKKKYFISFFRKLLSYIAPDMIEVKGGEVSSVLAVKLSNGKLSLDGKNVNYSFGGLHQLFQNIFQQLDFKNRRPEKILILGFGVGSVAHILRTEYGIHSHITGVELDKVVLELGNQYFNTSAIENLLLLNLEASDYAFTSKETFDLIVLDVFVESTVPPSVRSPWFLEKLSSMLNPKAMLIYNFMVEDEVSNENYFQLKNHLEILFPKVYTLRMQGLQRHNRVLIAEKGTEQH